MKINKLGKRERWEWKTLLFSGGIVILRIFFLFIYFNLATEIRVIVYIVFIISAIQLGVFYYEYNTYKKYSGFGWWMMWCGAVMAGVTVYILKSYGELNNTLTVLQHVFLVAGILFLQIGVLKFTGRNVRWSVVSGVCLLYLLILSYFTFVTNNLAERLELLNFSLAALLFYSAYNLLRYKSRKYASSAALLASAFILNGLVCLAIVYMNFIAKGDDIFFTTVLTSKIQFYNLLLGQVFWMLGIILMLNQRLNSELNDSAEHFKMIFTMNPEPASITNIEEGIIEDVNESFSNVFGFKRDEVIGMSTLGLNFWVQPEMRDEYVRRIKETGFCDNLEMEVRHKDGIITTGLISGKVIHINDKPFLLSVFRDISDRKAAELEIQQKNEELGILNAEKDRFFSIIAHDLRTPFNGMLGMTDIMANNIELLSKEEIVKFAHLMKTSADNLFKLLNNLLEWSMMQGGITEFKPAGFSLNPAITDIVNIFSDTAKLKNIELRDDTNEVLIVEADKNMIDTILRNLVSNAIKFTKRGGSISISARKVEQGVEVCVKDTGIGMKEEMVSNLFRIDKKTARPGTEKEPGTALGLLLCKEFADKHCSTLVVKSVEGEGSEFSFVVKSGEEVTE